MTIGIQGGKGSFSEQAAHNFANNHGLEGAEIVYQISSEHVLAGVENGKQIMVFLPWKTHKAVL